MEEVDITAAIEGVMPGFGLGWGEEIVYVCESEEVNRISSCLV